MTPELEQRRRDLKSSDPQLYTYIAHFEAAKALESMGDRLSGRDHVVANIVWHAAASAQRARQRMLEE